MAKNIGKRWRLEELVFRDVKSENETKRTAVILRLFCMVMWVYYIGLLAICLVKGDILVFEAAIPCGLLYMLSFYWTYKDRTRHVLWMVNGITLVWVFMIAVTLGLDCGIQHFLFALMMVVFMTSHARMRTKILYAAALEIAQFGLYLYSLEYAPPVVMKEPLSVAFEFWNTAAVCSMIILSMYVYSVESVEMERKLMDYNDRLKTMASIDPLTKLGNRRNIQEYMERKAEDYKKGNLVNLSVAIADIDFFKKINDHYGHECGDVVLKQLAVLMHRKLESKGKVGRWGGEEFLIVMPGSNGDEAVALLTDLLADIRRMEIEYNGEKVSITMTFGVTEYDFRMEVEETIKGADSKLYNGKANGRNRVVF